MTPVSERPTLLRRDVLDAKVVHTRSASHRRDDESLLLVDIEIDGSAASGEFGPAEPAVEVALREMRRSLTSRS